MGFFGSWRFSGLTSLGVIQFTDTCIPKNGEFREPNESDLAVRIVERIKYIEGPKVVDPVPLIVLTVFFLITIAIIIYVCLRCIRKERLKHAELMKRRIGPAPWTPTPSTIKKPFAVGDGVPADRFNSSNCNISDVRIDLVPNDSARVPLKDLEALDPDKEQVSLREIKIKSKKKRAAKKADDIVKKAKSPRRKTQSPKRKALVKPAA